MGFWDSLAKGFWILGIILLFLVPLTQAAPPVTSYNGYVTIDGIPTSNAMVKVLNSSCGELANETSTNGGLYQITVPWEDSSFNQSGVKAGETITFLMNGKFATSRLIDPKGSGNKLDLAILSSGATFVCKTNGGNSSGKGGVEVRGEAAEGSFLWDANNFPAFFYDLQGNIKTETLNISYLDGRSIPRGQIIYSTSPEETRFNYSNFGKYQVIGFMAEKYFAGYTENTTPVNPRPTTDFSNLSTLSYGQLHKVLIDDDTKRTISVGDTIALREGYALKAIDIDLSARTMLLAILKNGIEVDVSPLSADQTYVYYKNVSNVENLPLIMIRFESVFSGHELQVAFIKGLFQISEYPDIIKVGNQFGKMNVTGVTNDSITMNNSMDINLSKNTNTLLMGNIKLKVVDTDYLKYYPFVEYTWPGTYEVRGMVFNEPTQGSIIPSWNARTFAGFYSDLKYDISTETLGIRRTMEEIAANSRRIDEDRLWYITTTAPVDFKAFEKEGVSVNFRTNYSIEGWQGEKWVALNNKANKIAKLAFEMGKDDKKTLMTGETWSLGAGYDLTVNDLDVNSSPRQVWFTLKKDGEVLDQAIVMARVGSSIADKEKAMYFKTATIQDESNSLLFAVYVDNIFSGATSDMVQFKYAWLIDESSAKEIRAADKFGVFEVRASSPDIILLTNKNRINLSKNTELPLLGDFELKVADSDQLRFFLKKDFMIPDQSAPPTHPSVLINDGDANTSLNSVTLGISAGNATEMSFSNDNKNWSNWEPFSGTKPWKLSGNDGSKTVYFRARNAAGESSIASDTIILATPVRPKVNKVEIRGTVVSEPYNPLLKPVWDAGSFGAFIYDSKNDRATETLTINEPLTNLLSTRTINKDVLWYNTTKIPVDFKAYEIEGIRVFGKSSYDIVGWSGEKFVGIKGKTNKLAKLVLEMKGDDKKTIAVGEKWSLGAGYELTVNVIDRRTNPKQVWFTLLKDGVIIDEGIGQAPDSDTISDKEKAVYYKTMTIQGESDALLFTVYIDKIFTGKSSDIVQFKYGWLIDKDSTTEIKAGDRFGVFEVRTANPDVVMLSNEEIVNLSKNSETTLMGNMKFKVADNDALRFYPFMEFTSPGTYEIRGTVANEPYLYPSWDARSFAGFYYDLKYDRSTETLISSMSLEQIAANSRSIPVEQLWYNTSKASNDFKSYEKEGVLVNGRTNNDIVGWQGEKWIAVNNKANKIAKLAFEMGKEDKKTMTSGDNWSLGSGYEMTINAINASTIPRQVWFTLKKDGVIIDEGIGQAPQGSTVADKQKAVYYKTRTILGESDSLLFTVYVDAIFAGADSNMVQFKYAWLIDESSAKEIKAADKFGVFEVRLANRDYISLSNEYAVSLSKNIETPLMGDIKFKVADSDSLRFYPKVDREIGGIELPPHSLSILINQGEAYARSRNVTLSLSGIGATEMSFSNDGSSWSPREPYSTTKSWTLAEGEGLKTVYFMARNNGGEATQVSDSIILDTIQPSVNISSVSFEIPEVIMSVNSSRTLNLTLNTAPTGLSGYNITISVSNESVSQITDVGFPEWASIHSNSSLPSNTVRIKAADINKTIEAGASNITLARLGIRGEAAGITNVLINIQKMDDENGTMIDPDTSMTQINVISIQALPGLSKSPTDPDNDGLFEDINGNGKKDFNDVVLFFESIEWIVGNEPLHNFDFNENGRIDFNDIIRLFEEV